MFGLCLLFGKYALSGRGSPGLVENNGVMGLVTRGDGRGWDEYHVWDEYQRSCGKMFNPKTKPTVSGKVSVTA